MLRNKKFYSLHKIKEKDCTYNVIMGLRSNGKTFAVFAEGLRNYIEDHKQMALIRRWREDFIGKRGKVMFDALVSEGIVKKLSKGKWDNIKYYAGRWYLTRGEGDERITDDDPFCMAFSLSEMEHDKSTSYPNVTLICFDEFISRMGYLRDEFVTFQNVISTIVRHRADVKIYMLGNTVNKYCPYFSEMGLNHIKGMQPGQIDIYTYGDSRLRVAVEYCDIPEKRKKGNNDFYFAFDNPKLKMITTGQWEIDIYPHLPIKYKPKDIMFTYFIDFGGEILQCEIVHADHTVFTFIHKKTSDIKHPDTDIIYTPRAEAGFNYRRNVLRPSDNIDRKIFDFFSRYKVFYQDNETGEVVRNYLLWCKGLQ